MITVPKLHRPSRRLVKRVFVPLGLLALVVIAFMSSPFYHPALVRAARRGDAEAVARAIARGADLNRRVNNLGTEQFHGWTALMWAATRQRPEVIRLLTEAGADVNAKDSHDRTALYLVFYDIEGGPRDLSTRILLAAGADPNATTKSGETPLHAAARCDDAASVLLLIEAGADVNVENRGGDSPLSIARRSPKRVEVANLLRDHGAE